jgi:hypothetical protein
MLTKKSGNECIFIRDHASRSSHFLCAFLLVKTIFISTIIDGILSFPKIKSKLMLDIFRLKIIFFFGYHDIDTKFLLSLAMINLRRGICGAHKVNSLISTEFSPFA